jgi:hypothetical protein
MLVSLSVMAAAGTISSASQDMAPCNKQFSMITVRKSCEAMPADSCLGSYGFSVASDGKFKVGPDPKGNVIEGSITADELATLTSAVNAQLASGTKMTCSGHYIPGFMRVTAASFTDGTQVNLLTTGMVPGAGGEQCELGDPQKAKVVDGMVGKLLVKYYPRPFPAP